MPSVQARLERWLQERGLTSAGPVELAELLQVLAPIQESELRRRLRATGIALHPIAAGVDQDSFPALRSTLLALAQAYETAAGPGERQTIRRIVITAKDHAKLAARNPRVAPAHREEKEEMVAWMLTWLENPSIFPLWAALRAQNRPEFDL
ncbi:MAG TPA: hypothetical protein VFQ91_10970 [Bryobacteraceae bacterium]|nr:hypothetical protein [Bryobacteraceae bacterium]